VRSDYHRPVARTCIAGVPAYFYPWPASTLWQQFTNLRPGSLIIINPASGPGDAVDARYTAVIEKARGRGVVIFGYIDSGYGAIAVDRIAEETSRHRSWYPVDGILVDRVAPDDSSLPHYTDIARRVHAAGLSVAFNPGQPDIDAAYAAIADHVVVFEGPLSTYLESHFPRWMADIAPSRLWHLVYGVATADEMQHVVARAAASNAGLVYVTDGILPNPWDRLPPYWDSEQQLLHETTPGR